MTTVERKKRDKERRHADIIDAAERLFFTKGYESITMEDIAKEAELAKGTLYLYFDNKDSLYASVLLRGVEVFIAMINEAIKSEKTGLLKTRMIGVTFYELSKRYPHYFDMIAGWDIRRFPDLGDRVRKELASRNISAFNLSVAAIQSGIDDGSIRPDLDPAQTWLFLVESTKATIRVPLPNMGESFSKLSRDEIISFTLDRLTQSIENR